MPNIFDANSQQVPEVAAASVNSATLTNVAGSATSVAIVAANGSRRGFAVFNDSTAALYLAFGVAASTTQFTVKVGAAQLYEMPLPIFAGAINGLWDSATGSARVTEMG